MDIVFCFLPSSLQQMIGNYGEMGDNCVASALDSVAAHVKVKFFVPFSFVNFFLFNESSRSIFSSEQDGAGGGQRNAMG